MIILFTASWTENPLDNETYQHGSSAATTSLWILCLCIHGNNTPQSLKLFLFFTYMVHRFLASLVLAWVSKCVQCDNHVWLFFFNTFHIHTHSQIVFSRKPNGRAASILSFSDRCVNMSVCPVVDKSCHWGEIGNTVGSLVRFPIGREISFYSSMSFSQSLGIKHWSIGKANGISQIQGALWDQC